MGVVYAALDPQLDRTVALNVMKPGRRELDDNACLQREGLTLARLSHPNVVAIHDVGAAGSRAFIAVEFIVGRTLREWLRAGRQPWGEVLAMVCAAGRGLDTVHKARMSQRRAQR